MCRDNNIRFELWFNGKEDTMSDKVNTSAYTDDENIGKVQISDQVVTVIAGIAATEVEGVKSLVGNITNEIVSMMGIKNLSKGIHLHMIEDTVTISVTINIEYGYMVPNVCKAVQERVSTAIETMTGLSVAQVDVIVADITISKNS